MKKKLPHANVQESVAMAMGALVHTYCQYPDQCLHEVSGGNMSNFQDQLNRFSCAADLHWGGFTTQQGDKKHINGAVEKYTMWRI